MVENTAIVLLAAGCAVLAGLTCILASDYRDATRRIKRMELTNKHAHLLGRTVEAKVYEGSKWERMVVVAVSWKGAVGVRPEWDLRAKTRWIDKRKMPQRVREVRTNGKA